jgi:replicative DNA helicase
MEEYIDLPISEEGEKHVLGCVINNPSFYVTVSPYIKKDTFYMPTNKRLWNIIYNMHSNEEPIGLVTICGRLTQNDKNSGLDPYYITDLISDDGTENSCLTAAKQIYEKSLLRNVISSTKNIMNSAYKNNRDVYSMLDSTYQDIGNLIELRPSKHFKIKDILDKTIESIENSERSIIKTGFSGFDKLSGGLTRGEISIIGGRPGHGKTTAMINLVANSISRGLRVIVFNREMTNVEMLKKLLVLESGKLSYFNVRMGLVNDIETYAELKSTKEMMETKYSEENFAMYDNVNDFNEAASIIRKFKPDIIFDDYIQLIVPDKNISERRLQLERIVNDYKWLVKKTNSVAVLVSQLNREVERGNSREPKMSDLAESGAIEQVAENIMFVYYPYKNEKERNKFGSNQIKLIGSKVRYGVSGTSILGFDGDKVKLYESLEEMKRAGK